MKDLATPDHPHSHAAGWRWPLLVLAILPALLLLWIIRTYGVDLIFWDQWSPNFSGMFVRFHEKTLRAGDFFAQHNEHRMALPRLIFLLLGLVTHGDTRVQMLAQWIAICLTSLGITWLIARTNGRSLRELFRSTGLMVQVILCNLLIFSPLQTENALWGIGLANVLPMFFVVAALCVAGSRLGPWTKLALATLCAVLGVCSSGNGMLAWVLAAPVLAWSGSWIEFKRKIPLLLIWGCGFLVTLVLYFVRFETIAPIDGSSREMAGIMQIIRYNVVFLGNSLYVPERLGGVVGAAIVGVVVLLLYFGVIVFFARQWLVKKDVELSRRILCWLMVGGFAAGSGVMASLFRAQLGTEQATSSRYVSFAIYAIVALVNLVPMICAAMRQTSSARIWRAAPASLAGVVAVLCLTGIPAALTGAEEARAVRLAGKGALMMLNVLPDNPQLSTLVYPDVSHLQKTAPLLDRYGFIRPKLLSSRFASDIARRDPQGAASRGAMLKVEMTTPQLMTATGWAIDPSRHRAADAVFLSCEDFSGRAVIFIMARVGQPADGGKQPSSPPHPGSQWSVQFPISRIPPVLKHTRMAAWALDTQTGAAYKLDGEVAIDQ